MFARAFDALAGFPGHFDFTDLLVDIDGDFELLDDLPDRLAGLPDDIGHAVGLDVKDVAAGQFFAEFDRFR